MLRPKRAWRERSVPEDIVSELEHELGVSTLMARLLALRGVDGSDAGHRFLRRRLQDLLPPEDMLGMATAAQRFAQAIDQGETILIHGDYDVDGSTSTVLLKQFCRCLNRDAIGWIPDRRIDGYGLSEASLEAVKHHKAQLMITVDCGIADHGWAQRIEREGDCSVIITDHHLPQGSLPQCTAVCNPNQPDCPYPDKGLAGVGVAWKLCWATAKILSGGEKVTDRLRNFLLDALALVAVGTVADCAPLNGENRILVHHGLAALARTQNNGLRALLSHTRLDAQPINASDIGWKLGPLLNASGRLGSAMRNVHLLCASTPQEAQHILDDIIIENDERRRLTTDLTAEVRDEVERNSSYDDRISLVFAGDGWHQGVVGIVASRLCEEHAKPTAVIGIVDGVGKGSLRSIPGVHLGEAIDACRHLLIAGGGHALAAGLSIEPENVPAFIQAFEAHFREQFPSGLPQGGTHFDAAATMQELQGDFFGELGQLGPFGTGNPAPVLQVKGCSFAATPDLFGREANHLRGNLSDGHGAMQQLLAWNVGDNSEFLCRHGAQFNFLVRPEINYWRGREQTRLLLVDGQEC